jgi:hypothetical protein
MRSDADQLDAATKRMGMGTGPPPGVIGTWLPPDRRFPTPRTRSKHIVPPSRVHRLKTLLQKDLR